MTASANGRSRLWVFQIAYLSLCLFSFICLMPTFRSARPQSHLEDFLLRLNVIVGAAAFYATVRRTSVAWQLGWLVMGLAFSEWLVLCIATSLKLPSQQRWTASGAFLVVGLASGSIWAYRWNSMKKYFVGK
jgi:hypothetical protein